jgi:pyruvate dehydrogenase E2 component (dihydrolipoamide acetyltransferase)
MSLATWRDPSDPQVYGRLEVDMSNALQFAAAESARANARVTPTHVVVRAVALALKRLPAANAIIRWNRVYERQDIDVFCQVAVPGDQPDLSGAVIRQADAKRAGEIAAELAERARAVREDRDQELGKARRSLNLIPAFLYRFVLSLLAFFQYTLNLDLRVFGLPRDAFGSAMVTSIGSLGIPEGYAPLVPMSRCPVVVSVGKVEDRPVARDGQVVIRPVCIITAALDHRVMDGFTAGRLASAVHEYLLDPEASESRSR